jgi:hypothetical protein
MTRAITSLDWTVVPIQCAPEGCPSCGNRTPFDLYSLKPYGEMSGAKIARTMKNSVIAAPAQSMPRAIPVASRIGFVARPSAMSRARPCGVRGEEAATDISTGSSDRHRR